MVYIHMCIQVHVYLWVQGLHRVSYVSSLSLKSTAYQLAGLLWGLLVCGFHILQLQAGLLTPIMVRGGHSHLTVLLSKPMWAFHGIALG